MPTEIYVVLYEKGDSGTRVIKAFNTLESAKLYISKRSHPFNYDYEKIILEDEILETVPGPS